jgi:uncharacterized membrane protein YidH (DUF202 family)
VEPKLYFASERTLIHWMHMSVVISGLASAILAFASHYPRAEYLGLSLLPLALGFNLYAVRTFLWRVRRIKRRVPYRWDDPYGPVVLTFFMVLAMVMYFFLAVFV